VTARAVFAALALVAIAGSARPAAAQSWAPREGTGDVTFVTQVIDHVGRVFGDLRIDCCGTTNVGVGVDVNYGVSRRWSVSAGLPFVFAKYRGEGFTGPVSWVPYSSADSCHCVHGALQDVRFGAHYNLLRLRRSFSLMGSAALLIPTHNYEYVGEAVVGFGLREADFSVDAGQRLDSLVPGLSVDGHYGYTVSQRPLAIKHDRSNARFNARYGLTDRLAGYAVVALQRTHGGLRFPEDVAPFPERYHEFHRLLQDNYFEAGAGVSYAWGDWDLSFSAIKTVSGTNTHNVHVYTMTAGRAFRIGR